MIAELISFWKFYKKIPRTNREIVFYAEDRSQITYYQGLLNYITKEKNQKICYITSEKTDPIFQTQNPNTTVLYINKLLWLFTITLDSKVLVMTMPEIEKYHVKRSMRGTHHVYLYHNIGAAFTTLRFGALFHYDSVLLTGPHHKEELEAEEKVYELPPKKLIPFGYNRLDQIYNEYTEFVSQGKKTPCKYKARVLLGPSWGEKSILNLMGKEIIQTLIDGNYEVVLRPHTMTKVHDTALISEINKSFEKYPNYKYDGDGSSVQSLYDSDVLICDWSGLIYEYAFGTERPVLLVNTPQKILNERFKELGIEPMDNKVRKLIGETVEVNEVAQISDKLDKIIGNIEQYKEQIKSTRDKYVYHFNESSKVGGDYILSLS